jgi:RimJ/RimL family protein N-acetyltransferase
MSVSTDAQPTLTTERLILRPFTPEDAGAVQRLAGDRAVADTTARIPHPYLDGMAEAWIATHPQQFQARQECTFAVVLRDTSELIGGVNLTLNMTHRRGELGYWIGREFWRSGYRTEAAQAVVRYGFSVLWLHRIHACHLVRNPASGRVMQKLGMRCEGRLRQHACKWGVFEDVDMYGILCDEWEWGADATHLCRNTIITE